MEPELVRLLRRSDAYPHSVSEVELRETHISWVFLAGDRVYKVKKPVHFSFLDYSTLERRRFFCEEEVRLNRRLAADTYLGVVPVARAESGGLRIGGSGDPLEYAVEMVRLPATRMMDAMLARAEISNAPIDRLAEVLVRFHGRAATGVGVDEHGAPDGVRKTMLENLAECRTFLAPALADAIETWLTRFLDAERTLLEARVREARIREGHGDLHAGNLCFLESGVVAYDCVEFSAALRCGDVASDLAFLAMDLDARGFGGFGRYLVHRYAALSRDREVPRLVAFYRVHRALIRAKVAALSTASGGADLEIATGERGASAGYVWLAARYVLRHTLFLMCGLPGTGKSTVARMLAAGFDAVLIASDTTRKRLVGMAPTEHWRGDADAGPYTAAWTERTYDALHEQARKHLSDDRFVVVDATFPVFAWRERFAALAAELSVPAVVVHVDASEPVVHERLARRAHDPSEISDAGFDVYLRARERFEAPRRVPGQGFVQGASTLGAGPWVDRCIEELVDLGLLRELS